jgi:hypothetical protein
LIFDGSCARLVVSSQAPAREIDRHHLQRGNAFAGETGQSTAAEAKSPSAVKVPICSS